MKTISALIMLAAAAIPLHAVDGVVLINQNAALAGNVTPGDAPGFPVTISVSGSYKLSSNLVVPDANTTAIEITADNVTIDLNGFSIIGPVVCSGFPVTSCSPTGPGFGIVSNAASNITILNGKIQGMGSTGIALSGRNNRVEKVHVIGNGGAGIFALIGSSVMWCTASNNFGAGIGLDRGGVAINNVASGHRGDGIFSGGTIGLASVTFSGNTATDNGGHGISVNCPSAVIGNTAFGNSGGDISTAGSGCTRANNAPAP
jgi:Right handed beta helix region